ncbi:MAG: PepSY-like domain-containing protein [Verrucomicrobia bacterium]|nr:PepSY-like domain-containing protein [Verrucomicrobiota bacterium]MBI3868969.1 PepSY-like domain-containing protein [Verrucomicrobiota bacterium]
MNRLLPLLLILMIALAVGCSTPSGTQETPITQADVPSPVMESFKKQYPRTTIQGCAKEVKGRSVFYEILTDGVSAPHTVIFTPDGKQAETEVEIPFTQLPAAVQEAVRKASPNGKIKVVEIAQKRSRPAVYELEILESGRVVDYVFDMSGHRIQQKGE